MLLGMVLGGLRRMVDGMARMAVCGVRVMRRLLVSAGIMVLRGFTMMVGRVLVVLGRRPVMLGAFVSLHYSAPLQADTRREHPSSAV
jgi:hypothetical protein